MLAYQSAPEINSKITPFLKFDFDWTSFVNFVNNKWICLRYLVVRIKIKEDLCAN